ncbi:SpoIVB peptidase [Clostridium neuense]|uniref:SpoIVB peptidase n=1 Tax=Clostridium neuense TaxID=1728934 RepID=A0ABW8TGX4_9CLOT
MKKIKAVILYCVLTPIIIMSIFTYNRIRSIPETIFVRQGENISKYSFLSFKPYKTSNSTSKIKLKKDKVNVSILGILPVKTVNLKAVPKIKLYPGGQPVGIKLSTKGVLIVGFSDINTLQGKIPSPAAKAGLQIGDSLIKVNNQNVLNSKDLANKISKSEKEQLNLTIERKGEFIEKKVPKIKSEDDENYKIGLWVRDSTAGIGTLTFYYDKGNQFAALGHPITDVDTGTILKINSGNLINSSVVSVRKGVKGTPGEIRGIFVNEESPIGAIYKNTICGVFGKGSNSIKSSIDKKPIEIGLRNEIKAGEAQILTTINGDKPEAYSIQIEKLFDQQEPGPKSMIIRVTDQRLLKKTGGIVQGMSGSPIIQNGKIVGAVTHVLVNKPEVGYGIYIEWMLKSSGIL